TFHFTIPLRAAPRAPGSPLFSPALFERLRGRRVLIVDDHAAFRVHLLELLGGWCMEPVATDSATEAGRLFRHGAEVGPPFDLLLVDSTLPELRDSTQLQPFWTEWWASSPVAPPKVAMLLLCTSLGRDAEVCRLLGVNAYLTKPIRESAALNILAQL